MAPPTTTRGGFGPRATRAVALGVAQNPHVTPFMAQFIDRGQPEPSKVGCAACVSLSPLATLAQDAKSRRHPLPYLQSLAKVLGATKSMKPGCFAAPARSGGVGAPQCRGWSYRPHAAHLFFFFY